MSMPLTKKNLRALRKKIILSGIHNRGAMDGEGEAAPAGDGRLEAPHP